MGHRDSEPTSQKFMSGQRGRRNRSSGARGRGEGGGGALGEECVSLTPR